MNILLVAAMLVMSMRVSAAPPADYRPPAGFNGHDWGTSLAALRGLTLWRADEALGFRGKTTEFHCVSDAATGETCSVFNSKVEQHIEGEGSHALAEYYFRYDNNPWHQQGVDLKAITYLFCASARGDYLPTPVKKSLRLCGARVLFDSDTPEELATRGEDYVSNYDRVLGKLIADYGQPPGYERRGSVTVTSADVSFTSADRARPLQGRYRWCGLDDADKQLSPPCVATVTLSIEAATGEGTILFATAPVHVFAYARHVTGDENNDLYALLEGQRIQARIRRKVVECTGNRICQPSRSAMSARQLRNFQP
jgi:hypothetical protein